MPLTLETATTSIAIYAYNPWAKGQFDQYFDIQALFDL
jgi:hypothetical protein